MKAPAIVFTEVSGSRQRAKDNNAKWEYAYCGAVHEVHRNSLFPAFGKSKMVRTFRSSIINDIFQQGVKCAFAMIQNVLSGLD